MTTCGRSSARRMLRNPLVHVVRAPVPAVTHVLFGRALDEAADAEYLRLHDHLGDAANAAFPCGLDADRARGVHLVCERARVELPLPELRLLVEVALFGVAEVRA